VDVEILGRPEQKMRQTHWSELYRVGLIHLENPLLRADVETLPRRPSIALCQTNT
jgi:hypothetical protein